MYRFPNVQQMAQWLVFLTLIAVLISPPVANIAFGLTLIWVCLHSELRQMIAEVFYTKIGKIIILWLLWILITSLWSIATVAEAASGVFSWRKLFFLWIAFAVFQSCAHARDVFVERFLRVGALLIAISFFVKLFAPYCIDNSTLNFFGVQIAELSPRSVGRLLEGTIVRDRIIQSIVFSTIGVLALHHFYHTRKRLYALLAGVVALNLFIVTAGRSGYVFFFIALILYMLLEPKFYPKQFFKKCVCMILVATVLTVGFFSFNNSRERITRAATEFSGGVIEPQATSIGLRILFWKHALKRVPDYIFHGAGAGGFEKAYNQYLETPLARTADPHNQYLRLLIEQGILGLVFLFSLLVLLIKNAEPKYIAVLSAIVIGISVSNMFNSHFTSYEGLFLWGFLGMLAANNTTVQRKIRAAAAG